MLSSQSITETKSEVGVSALNKSASTRVVSVYFCTSLSVSVKGFEQVLARPYMHSPSK